MGDAAHGQVFVDQKLDQTGVICLNAVLPAKQPHIARAQFGVVAAAALGNVMKEGRHIEDPGLVPAGGQLRAGRVFVRMLGHEKTAHIAQDHQDVLIDGVDMKQVMLHLADDAPKHPQVAAQHRGLIHQAYRVGDALWLLQDLPESLPIDRVAAKARVHDAAGVVEGAQGSG